MRMPLKVPTLFLALLLSVGPTIQAQGPVESVQSQEWATFLGAPPATASDEGKADLAIVLWHQRTRTQPEIQRALSEVKLSAGAYSTAAGVSLDAVQYPKTTAMIDKVGKDIKVVTDSLKKHFMRPRPYQADARVQPAIERETSPSYPSGHATRGLVFAIVLAELAPDRREALLAQGRLVGVDRVIGGVHYPSDIESGQRLAIKLAEGWLTNAQNRSLVESVRAAEWTGAPKH
jgi:acid phosphatase (class A)